MLGLAPGVKSAPLLRVERGRRPTSGFEETHQLITGYAFARHRTGRPAVEDERFDRVVCLAFFATFDHERNETRGEPIEKAGNDEKPSRGSINRPRRPWPEHAQSSRLAEFSSLP